MKNFMVFAALLLSSTQAFAFDCDPFHLRFLASAGLCSRPKANRASLQCTYRNRRGGSGMACLFVGGLVSGDERRKIESRLSMRSRS